MPNCTAAHPYSMFNAGVHLVFAGLDTGTKVGGAGGIGSGNLDPTSAGVGAAVGAESGSNMLFMGFSGGV